ncbi:MAG: hypothetical protein H6565_07220 [Lewinellaceae bacterium]|nr:hypothetical protein [Lewinellaceae bacterium]
MKSFFEFLGFVSTALISGFIVFSYVGHQKNADRTPVDALVTNLDTEKPASLPELKPVSSQPLSPRSAKSTPKNTGTAYTETRQAAPAVSATERLKDLYSDATFVRNAAKKWKKAVASASDAYSVKPHLLLSNVILQSYIGNYSNGDFKRDVSAHAGDLALPNNAAVKSYEYAWSVAKIAEQYDLADYFPAARPVAAANVSTSYKAPAVTKKAATKEKAKPAATTTPAEAGFREMVAKEEGFTSWQGLQRLGDIDTKKRAEKRVKMLLGAARVR